MTSESAFLSWKIIPDQLLSMSKSSRAMDGEHHRTNAIDSTMEFIWHFIAVMFIIGVTNTIDSAFQIFTERLNESLLSSLYHASILYEISILQRHELWQSNLFRFIVTLLRIEVFCCREILSLSTFKSNIHVTSLVHFWWRKFLPTSFSWKIIFISNSSRAGCGR